MKKIALISALAVSGLFYNTANAQIHLGLRVGLHLPGITIAAQTPVYREAAYNDMEDYYYLPDVDAYYSVNEQAYYYNDGYNWISAAYLPGEYRNYDWRNARRYEVRAHRPFMNNDFYRDKYRGNVGNWSRFDNHNDRNNYANRDFNRDDHRNSAPAFERGGNAYRGAEHADDRGRDYGNRGNDRFDNRGQANYGQSSQPNRGQQGGFGQQGQQPSRGDNNGQQGQPGRNNGGNAQPSQPAMGQGQPSHQNGGGQQQKGNGGEQHFTDNRTQGGQSRFSRS
jgi:hypothetical protein